MRIAIYIVEGTTQLILTPETDWERNATRSFAKEGSTFIIREGSFYECQGGWYREGGSDTSFILRLDEPINRTCGKENL